MTIQVKELQGSKKLRRPSGGDRSAERSFIVYDDEGVIPTIDDILLAPGMPVINQSHPDNSSLFATGYNFSLNPDRNNTWNVTWEYTPFVVADTNEDEEPLDQDNQQTSDAFSVSISQTIIDIWRTNPTIPSNTDSPGAATDIGGDEVHERGLAISKALSIANISITKTIVTPNFNAGGLLNNVTKRNNAVWLGLPAGSVLFKGVNINRTQPNTYSVSYECAYDSDYHLRQVPKRAEDGNPEFVSTASPTLDVYFRQPFPDTVSFNFIPNP